MTFLRQLAPSDSWKMPIIVLIAVSPSLPLPCAAGLSVTF